MAVPDGKGGTVLQEIQPGQAVPSGAVTSTQMGWTECCNDKALGGGEKAISYANDYLKNGDVGRIN